MNTELDPRLRLVEDSIYGYLRTNRLSPANELAQKIAPYRPEVAKWVVEQDIRKRTEASLWYCDIAQIGLALVGKDNNLARNIMERVKEERPDQSALIAARLGEVDYAKSVMFQLAKKPSIFYAAPIALELVSSAPDSAKTVLDQAQGYPEEESQLASALARQYPEKAAEVFNRLKSRYVRAASTIAIALGNMEYPRQGVKRLIKEWHRPGEAGNIAVILKDVPLIKLCIDECLDRHPTSVGDHQSASYLAAELAFIKPQMAEQIMIRFLKEGHILLAMPIVAALGDISTTKGWLKRYSEEESVVFNTCQILMKSL